MKHVQAILCTDDLAELFAIGSKESSYQRIARLGGLEA